MRPLFIGWAGRTHCKYDHEYTPENTTYHPKGFRLCKACAKRRRDAWKVRHKEARRQRASALRAFYKSTIKTPGRPRTY